VLLGFQIRLKCGLVSTTVGTISSPAQLQHTTVLDPPFSLFVVTGTVMGDSNPKSRNLKLNCAALRAVLIDAAPPMLVQFEISGFWI
jgi:hypothetical protein